jgi:Fe2+ or Zn2+ uptake regulation protein
MTAHVVEQNNVSLSPLRELVIEIFKEANEEELHAELVVVAIDELEKSDSVTRNCQKN